MRFADAAAVDAMTALVAARLPSVSNRAAVVVRAKGELLSPLPRVLAVGVGGVAVPYRQGLVLRLAVTVAVLPTANAARLLLRTGRLSVLPAPVWPAIIIVPAAAPVSARSERAP